MEEEQVIDPGAVELSAWETAIQGGADFSTVRATLVANPVGVAHIDTEVTSLYDTFFGRDPNAAELNIWQTAIQTQSSVGFDQLRDTLERNPASAAAGVQLLTGSAQSDIIAFPANWQNAVIQDFSPTADTLSLGAHQFAGINPLDAAHAHEITALDGQTDVLIQLDPTHSILLTNTHLASLNSGDFVFG